MISASEYKYVVVGSGFFGAVVAERIANVLRAPVLVIERRDHFGGNSFSERDRETGIEFHRYGTHLFHTSNIDVWTWINQYTGFNNYRHRVLTRHRDRMYTMPINLMTLNNFFGLNMTPSEAESFIARRAQEAQVQEPANFEEKAISLVGPELYHAFIRGYTAKQWETSPTLLPAATISRLPVRFNYNDFYFSDLYEGLPLEGYHAIFERIFSNPYIKVVCNCDYFELKSSLRPDALTVYTGPIDRYFDYRLGPLGWRTLDFEIERPKVNDFQGASVVNYPDDDVAFTRIHEFKHLHPERRHKTGSTLIMKEYSRFASSVDEPYYPINTPTDKKLYDGYAALAAGEQNIIFGGRLGTYRYLDMHQAIGAALKTFETQFLARPGKIKNGQLPVDRHAMRV